MQGRYFCFTIVVRVNQIEVAPGVNVGVDQRMLNTLDTLVKYRTTIASVVPDARITIAFSHEALSDQSENFVLLRQKAKEYHDLYGDDVTYMLGAYFAGAYSPRAQINSHVDEALSLLRAFMGQDYLPRCIVGGFVPASVMDHIASLGVRTVQGIIFSQYAIDNQDGDGSMCYPYYPSKEHFCKPSQGPDDHIDVVVFDGWTVDFINATYPGYANGYNSRMGCGPIETFNPFGNEKGSEVIVNTAAEMLDESYALNGNFGFAAAIWELNLIHENSHHKVRAPGLKMFLEKLTDRFPDISLITYGELGDIFRASHRTNDTVNYHFIHRGHGVGGSLETLEIEWYMNKFFRLGFRRDLETGERKVIDFTDYTKPAQEPADSDYLNGIVHRNWSLMGDINQKGLREQDKPIDFDQLTDAQKALIRRAEEAYGVTIR